MWSKLQFQRTVVAAVGLLLVMVPSALPGQRVAILRIGASSTLSPADWTAAQEKVALQSLQRFIQAQTGLNNEITHEKDWHVIVNKMAKGQYHLGVFPGHEFAWAQAKSSNLKPVALAVNGPRYAVISFVTHRNNQAMNFAATQQQSLALPPCGQKLARLFVEGEAKVRGQKLDGYFSKIVSSANIEDALDDVVDGVVQVAAVDRIGLEAYQRRKPGRFKMLKEIARSQPFPPVVVASYDKSLDALTLRRFREGLLGAHRKQKGEVLLTLFRLTAFEEIPEDFGRVLGEVRRAYPPNDGTE